MSEPEKIIIRVVSAEGNENSFKIRPTTVMGKIMESFEKSTGKKYRYVFDGKRIDANETAADLNMVTNDVIDALIEKTGGNNK